MYAFGSQSAPQMMHSMIAAIDPAEPIPGAALRHASLHVCTNTAITAKLNTGSHDMQLAKGDPLEPQRKRSRKFPTFAYTHT